MRGDGGNRGATAPAPVTWRTLRAALDDLQRDPGAESALDRQVSLRMVAEGEVCISRLTSLMIAEPGAEPGTEDVGLVLSAHDAGVVVGCPSWTVRSASSLDEGGAVVQLSLDDGDAQASVELSLIPSDPEDDELRVAHLTIRCASDRQALATCLRAAARILREYDEEEIEVDLADLLPHPRDPKDGRTLYLLGPKAWEAPHWILGQGYWEIASAEEPGN